MSSSYLRRLPAEEMEHLRQALYDSQNGNCFICSLSVPKDLKVADIDHIVPTSEGGVDDPRNFALTHESCNRSKQANNLMVARVLARFDAIAVSLEAENRSPNLGDVLAEYDGGKYCLPITIANSLLEVRFPEIGESEMLTSPIFKDELSGFSSAFVNVPIEYLHHDDRINPRTIGSNLRKLVIEFHKKHPQLHVSLGWVNTANETSSKVKVKLFDGQHKAAAQILLGARRMPVRVFINPDEDALLTTNTNAGTTLRQVAFDKSVQRSLGSSILSDRIDRFRKDRNLRSDDESFSAQDLVNHFRGEAPAMRRYVVDRVRNGITDHPDNRLRKYIELGGRSTERPLSYSTIEKTLYQFFVVKDVLATAFDHKYEEGRNPRQLEIEQIVRIMNILANNIYIDQFDFARGTASIERDVRNGKDVPEPHLRACRISREEVMYALAKRIRSVVHTYFLLNGQSVDIDTLFQVVIPEICWNSIERFLDAFVNLPVWVNRDLSTSVFGAKPGKDFWQSIFETGSTPLGVRVLSQPLNLVEMAGARAS